MGCSALCLQASGGRETGFFILRGLVFGVRTVIVSGFGGGQRRGGQAGGKYQREVSLVRCFMVMSFSLEANGSGILGLRLFNGC